MLSWLIELLFQKLFQPAELFRHIFPALHRFTDRKIAVRLKLLQKELMKCICQRPVICIFLSKQQKRLIRIQIDIIEFPLDLVFQGSGEVFLIRLKEAVGCTHKDHPDASAEDTAACCQFFQLVHILRI